MSFFVESLGPTPAGQTRGKQQKSVAGADLLKHTSPQTAQQPQAAQQTAHAPSQAPRPTPQPPTRAQPERMAAQPKVVDRAPPPKPEPEPEPKKKKKGWFG